MKKEIRIILLLSLVMLQAKAQTVLYPGDIAIVGIQTDNPDDFSFVFLTAIKRHTVVFFTDCGVKADGSFRNGEGGLRYEASQDLPPGTLVNLIRDSLEFSKANDAVLGSRGFNLSSSGDQVIAFQDSSIHPHYLFAIQTNSSQWQNECSNTNCSCIPSGLIEGYSAFCAGKDTGANNYFHNAALKQLPSGKTRNECLKDMLNRANWKFANTIFELPLDKLEMVADSTRFLSLQEDSLDIYNCEDSLKIFVKEANITRLNIWFRNLSLNDSILVCEQWPTQLKNFIFKIPYYPICDSFQLELEDSDFPSFKYYSHKRMIRDTIALRFEEIYPIQVSRTDSIILKFNKVILPIARSIVIRNESDYNDSITLTYTEGDLYIAGNEVILRVNKCKQGTRYIIEIPEGWMSDLRGNLFNGISKDSYPIIELQSEIIPDTKPPKLIFMEPCPDDTINPGQKIRFVFDEPLYSSYGDITDPSVLGDMISIADKNEENYYDFIIEFDSLCFGFTIQPIGLEEGCSYIISIYGISDSIGNESEEIIYSFETTVSEFILNNGKKTKTLILYPNPAKDLIQIEGVADKIRNLSIVDMNGRYLSIPVLNRSLNNITLDIHSLPEGIYILRITDNKALKQLRFIKKL